MTGPSRLAVLGSPIAHSLSPAIHRAAYRALRLDWSYDAVEVTGDTLGEFLAARDSTWRGLSLTMPLKRDILPLLDARDPLVDVVGAANTVTISADHGVRGFNTDVYGVERSFRDSGVDSLESVHILGAGATAASVMTGVAGLGADRISVAARTPSKAAGLVDLGERLGINVAVMGWDASPVAATDAVVSTVPGGQQFPHFDDEWLRNSTLFDVAYDPWPSALASSWQAAGGAVISGLELLLNQAVGQVRVFVSGDPLLELDNEAFVVTAMRAALPSH